MVAESELNCAVAVEGPETTLQTPVPTAGVLAASRALALLQMVCAPPAFAVLGIPATVTVTSSNAGAQGALLTVHRKVYGLPATLRPVMVVVLRLAFVMEAAPPPTLVHEPVPVVGATAAIVAVPVVAHTTWSAPALIGPGAPLTCTLVVAEVGHPLTPFRAVTV